QPSGASRSGADRAPARASAHPGQKSRQRPRSTWQNGAQYVDVQPSRQPKNAVQQRSAHDDGVAVGSGVGGGTGGGAGEADSTGVAAGVGVAVGTTGGAHECGAQLPCPFATPPSAAHSSAVRSSHAKPEPSGTQHATSGSGGGVPVQGFGTHVVASTM